MDSWAVAPSTESMHSWAAAPSSRDEWTSLYLELQRMSDLRYSGVGTVAAVAALAATLFRPQINILKLLIAQASLVPWERG